MEELETRFVSGIQNPISPVPAAPAAQGCRLACSVTISQVVRTKMLCGSDKKCPYSKTSPLPRASISKLAVTSCQIQSLFTPPVSPHPPHTCGLVQFGSNLNLMQPPSKSAITPPFLSALILDSWLQVEVTEVCTDTLNKSPLVTCDTQTTEFVPMDTWESTVKLNSRSGQSEESATAEQKIYTSGRRYMQSALFKHSNKYAYYF